VCQKNNVLINIFSTFCAGVGRDDILFLHINGWFQKFCEFLFNTPMCLHEEFNVHIIIMGTNIVLNRVYLVKHCRTRNLHRIYSRCELTFIDRYEIGK
jgi:hypothetical protein